MAGCFDFLSNVYGIFGFDFQLKLSTRPEKHLGAISVWDNAEKVVCLSLYNDDCKYVGRKGILRVKTYESERNFSNSRNSRTRSTPSLAVRIVHGNSTLVTVPSTAPRLTSRSRMRC